jgi:hypothetical protein
MPKVQRPKKPCRTPRQRCRLCNHLDPKGHPSSSFNDKAKATAHLTLTIEIARLKRVSEGGCRFCLLLCQALDKSANDWRKGSHSIQLDLVEQQPVILSLPGSASDSVVLQIYSPAGMFLDFVFSNLFPIFYSVKLIVSSVDFNPTDFTCNFVIQFAHCSRL